MTEKAERFRALHHRGFRLLWAAISFSGIGTWAHVVAQGWLMYQLTNSPLWLGYIGLVRAVPLLTFPLIGGLVADRVSRGKVFCVTQAAAMLAVAILAVLVFIDAIEPWHLLGLKHSILKHFIPVDHFLLGFGEWSYCAWDREVRETALANVVDQGFCGFQMLTDAISLVLFQVRDVFELSIELNSNIVCDQVITSYWISGFDAAYI
jgi:MFS family permease